MKSKTRFMAGKFMIVIAVATMTFMPVEKAYAIFGLGDIVYDPANHAENVLQATRALVQINNQLRQLAQQARMLTNQTQNLVGLPVTIAADLQTSLTRIDMLIRRAKGIAYQVAVVDREYRRFFPEHYTSDVASSQIMTDAAAAWGLARAGFRHALEMQAEVMGEVRRDASVLDRLIVESHGAVGNLQALQAGNQLTALATKQSMQLQSLIAAADRANALDRARALAIREQGRSRFDRFVGAAGAYTRY